MRDNSAFRKTPHSLNHTNAVLLLETEIHCINILSLETARHSGSFRWFPTCGHKSMRGHMSIDKINKTFWFYFSRFVRYTA